MRRIARTLMAVVAVSLVVSGAAAALIVQTNGQTGTTGGAGPTSVDYIAQSFSPNSSQPVEQIGMYLIEDDAEGEVKLMLAPESDSGQNPDLSESVFNSSLIDPNTTGGWYYADVSGVSLNTSGTYYLVIDGYQNSGATGHADFGTGNETNTGDMIRYSDDGGSTWNDLQGFASIYISYSESTPTPTATATATPTDGNATGTPIVDGKQSPGEIWESFLVFVGFITLFFAGLAGLASRSMAVGATAAYVAFGYLAISTGHTLLTNILYVSLVVVIIGMALKMWRMEFGGEI